MIRYSANILNHVIRLRLRNRTSLVIAIGNRPAHDAGISSSSDINFRIADKQAACRHFLQNLQAVMNDAGVRFLNSQGIPADHQIKHLAKAMPVKYSISKK